MEVRVRLVLHPGYTLAQEGSQDDQGLPAPAVLRPGLRTAAVLEVYQPGFTFTFTCH